ncbi:ATP-grasp domain-containing protein [Zoogloea dura]|uniref:ATP-grasp domain-containing protein n=1 Tax=Zoogloea dura TaxID=2728840 RepID=A0A848GEC1_9RHOO|nr:hypothetical protein [Zoogloea dura]NML27791.1 hypothetical protein [Zoogloea dura]
MTSPPAARRPCVLFLSGASLVGQNVLASLDGRRNGLHLAAINSVAAEPALFDFDEAFLCGNLRDDPDAFTRRFEAILDALRPHLVIPCRDDDVAYLAAHAEAHPAHAPRFLCGARRPAEAMLDKAASAALAQDHGLPFAPTLATDTDADPSRLTAFAAHHGYPLIAKPRQGFASRGVFLVLNEAQLLRLAGRPDYILQAYLGDPDAVRNYVEACARDGVPLFHSFEMDKYSIQAFIAPDGQQAGLLATRHAMRQGRSERVAHENDPALLALGRRCASAFAAEGWRGPLNIQCQRSPAGDYGIYEFNGRYTGATSARRLLGYDEVGMGLAHFAGIQLDTAPSPTAWPVDVLRLPVSRALETSRIEQLKRDGHWRAEG